MMTTIRYLWNAAPAFVLGCTLAVAGGHIGWRFLLAVVIAVAAMEWRADTAWRQGWRQGVDDEAEAVQRWARRVR